MLKGHKNLYVPLDLTKTTFSFFENDKNIYFIFSVMIRILRRGNSRIIISKVKTLLNSPHNKNLVKYR
jgi:hypothetical protein